MEKQDTIYVAGHRGMVGSAIFRALEARKFENIITASRTDLDLRNPSEVQSFIAKNKPEYVFLAAAKVGGIQANITFPADFLYDNLMIQNNVIHACHLNNVKKVLFLGSSCIYPKECPQPMREEYLMTGPLEPTNEGYALAKIAGLKMAEYYHQQYRLHTVCPMPCNLYGPNDSFDPRNSHVISALVKKFVDARESGEKKVEVWGSGLARREFMHVDDAARACLFLMENWDSPGIVNVGPGTDISIKDLAEMIAGLVGFTGDINWNTTMPDGMMRKCLDVSKMKKLGFKPEITLEAGLRQVINDYQGLKDKGQQ
jgi:GDP-L-fucose synthase